MLSTLEQNGVRDIAILGVNELSEILYLSVKETAINVAAILDANSIGNKFFEFIVENPALFDYATVDKVIVTSVENDEMRSTIRSISELDNNKYLVYWLETDTLTGNNI